MTFGKNKVGNNQLSKNFQAAELTGVKPVSKVRISADVYCPFSYQGFTVRIPELVDKIVDFKGLKFLA